MNADLRLQLRHVEIGEQHAYRFARANGWHCGHWHRFLADAVACIRRKSAIDKSTT